MTVPPKTSWPFLLVALTGTIGSGKSTVSDFMQKHGLSVIDADVLAREVVSKDSPGLTAVIKQFGPIYLLPDGTLDRKALGQNVFSNPIKRKELEEILHPRIRQLFKNQLEELLKSPQKPSIVIYSIPLLFETELPLSEFDQIVVVSAPAETCINRIMKRDQCTRDLASKKLSQQLPIELKAQKADIVIPNESTVQELEAVSMKAIKKLQNLASQKIANG